METTALLIIGFITMTLLLSFFVLSIYIIFKSGELKRRYQLSNWKCLLFASFTLTPLTLGIPSLLNLPEPGAITGVIMCFVYPAISVAIFAYWHKEYTFEYKMGKFFAMLGVGMCVVFVLGFEIIKRFHNAPESDVSDVHSHNSKPFSKAQSFYNENGQYHGYINEYGQIYDDTGAYRGYVNETGQRYDENGYYKGYINEYGQNFDETGRYRGYTNKYGQHIDENGNYRGYHQ